MKSKILFSILLLAIVFVGNANPNYYHWDQQVLNTSAPLAQSNGLQYGDGNVYYANPSGLITRAYPSGNTWLYENITGITPVKYGSVFSYGDWKLYYIGTDNKVHNLYKSGTTWVSPVMQSSSAPARGDGLIFTENSTLFYTSTGNTICKLQWNGITWAFTNYASVFVRTNTKLAYGDWKLYFVDNTSKIRNMIQSTPGNWYDGGQMNPNAPAAMGDGIVFGASGELFYTDTNDSISRLFWTGSGWQYETIKTAPCIWNNYNPNLVYDQGRLFYTNNASLPTVVLKDACEWFSKTLCLGSTAAPYRLTFGNGKLFGTYGNQVSCFGPSIDNTNYPYVYLKGKTFYKNNNTPMYPKIMNYIIDVVTDDDVTYWIEPYKNFNPTGGFYSNSATALAAMSANFSQIASLGCNAIRVIGMAAWNDTTHVSPNYTPMLWAFNRTTPTNYDYQPLTPSFEAKFFPLIKQMLDSAEAHGLKVIFVTGQGDRLITGNFANNYMNYLSEISSYSGINSNPALLAYDVYNEPGGIYSLTDKVTNCTLSYDMYNNVRANDPNHLITIGTFGGADVMTWDPSLLSCDFFSFHFYTGNSADWTWGDIQQQMYWAKQNVRDRPWTIGETGFISEERPNVTVDNCQSSTVPPVSGAGYNGWGPENTQKNYVIQTENWTRGAGGSGYSYWCYHDDWWGPAYWGILSDCDRLKPAAYEFNKDFLNQSLYPCDNTAKPSDNVYYNINTSQPYKLTGTILDAWGQPIGDALIYCWDASWAQGSYTYTKSNGTYELWTSFPVAHFRTSAKGKTVIFDPGTFTYSYVAGTPNTYAAPSLTLNDISGCNMPGGLIRQSNSETKVVLNDISIFPNPTDGNFTLQSTTDDEFYISIYNLMGECVKQDHFTGKSYSGNLSDFSDGVYLIEIHNTNRAVSKSLKIIVK